MRIIQLVLALAAWPLLSMGNPVVTVVVIAISYGIGVNVMLGAQCAALPELFGARHRYIGVAIIREFSAIIAGGIAPFVGALLLGWFSNSWIPLAIYVIVLTADHPVHHVRHPGDQGTGPDTAAGRHRGHAEADRRSARAVGRPPTASPRSCRRSSSDIPPPQAISSSKREEPRHAHCPYRHRARTGPGRPAGPRMGGDQRSVRRHTRS